MLKQSLDHLALFQGLNQQQLDLLMPLLKVVIIQPEQVVFEQNRPADYLYILLTGEVVVSYKPYDGPPLTVARIQPGGVFGWSAVMQREVYTSRAVASVASEAYRISGDKLRCLCETHPDTGVVILERLASVIAERLRNTHHHILDLLNQGMDSGNKCKDEG